MIYDSFYPKKPGRIGPAYVSEAAYGMLVVLTCVPQLQRADLVAEVPPDGAGDAGRRGGGASPQRALQPPQPPQQRAFVLHLHN